MISFSTISKHDRLEKRNGGVSSKKTWLRLRTRTSKKGESDKMSTEVIVAIAVVITAMVTMLITKWYCRREYEYELEEKLYCVNHRHKMEKDKMTFENGLLKDTIEYRTQKLSDNLNKAMRRNGTLAEENRRLRAELEVIQTNHPEIDVKAEVYDIEHPHL